MKTNQWFFHVVIIEYQELKSVVLDFHQSHNMITKVHENSAKGLEVEMDTHACTHTCAYAYTYMKSLVLFIFHHEDRPEVEIG